MLPPPPRRCVWVTLFVVLFFAAPLLAQATAEATSLQELNRTVLQALRDGDLEQALQLLAAVAETSRPLAEDDPLAPACAGLHRALAQLDSEEQFAVLREWTLPNGSPPKLRVLTALVPTTAPPAEFARALGERPRANSFAVASIGEVRGLFSTAWSLVAAAREAGALKRLIAELSPLAEQQVTHARWLLTLAQLADNRGEPSKPTEFLTARLQELQVSVPPSGVGLQTIDPADVVLAAAALQHPTLRSLGEQLFEALLAATYGQSTPRIRAFLRQAHATAGLSQSGEHDVTRLLTPRFRHWVPAPDTTGFPAVWLMQEGHLLNLAGPDQTSLLLRYPLQGKFEFQCETQTGGRIEADGGLVYGGLTFRPSSSSHDFSVWDTDNGLIGRRPCPFLRATGRPTFNRLSLKVRADAVTAAVNRHPLWTDHESLPSSPWLGLHGMTARRPLFRNLTLIGQPMIPRSVKLAEGHALRGWQQFRRASPTAEPESAWQLHDGILHASAPDSAQESLLSYQRPLLTGETVSYELFYEDAGSEVSPALGRLAFWLQPDGVRIHWVTDGDHEWTGLTADNAVVEPLNRRGPRRLPFKEKDWNLVTFTRTAQGITLALNDVMIYQRPMPTEQDQQFGLHRQSALAARVRNLVLTGDWPETLPPDFLEQPLTLEEEPPSVAVRHAVNRLMQDEFLAENVFVVRRQASVLPLAERFAWLSQWVLPGRDHPGFRVAGEFLPSQPLPDMANAEEGGRIVSPVFDWIDAAIALDQLGECRRLVEAAEVPKSEFQQRARAALLVLLNLELNDQAAATAESEKLFALVKSQTATGIEDQWPETLVIDRGARKFAGNAAVTDLITYIHTQRTQQWRPTGINLWHAHIAALASREQFLKNGGTDGAWEAPLDLKNWIPVSAEESSIRGTGYPPVQWHRNGETVSKISGRDDDYLFYRLPLSGNYEVECDLMIPSQHPSQVLLAGGYVGPRWDLKSIEHGTFRSASPHQPIEPPFTKFAPWVHYRGVIRDGVRTVFVNGRQVQSETLAPQPDPWIALRCWSKQMGSVRDFRITGQPTVLETVPLSASKDLTGWIAYYEETIGLPDSRWQHLGVPGSSGEIVGRRMSSLSETFSESLLRYQRPLVENGAIEYEFFYEPGVHETHPAFDRLAFLLHPSGVREHGISDGRYDRTELSPDNVAEFPERRRGPANLPLKVGDWNHLKLAIRASTVVLELNGQFVYERDLEPTNLRTFGLFHYLDTEVRVRNVTMRGDWPKSLPPVSDQELAGHAMDALEDSRSRLAAVFTHDFTKDGAPSQYFRLPSSTSGKQIAITPEGIHVLQTATGPYAATDIACRFRLSGDFDIEAAFAQFRTASDKDAGTYLIAMLDEPKKPHHRVVRMRTTARRDEVQSSLSMLQPDSSRSYRTDVKTCEAVAGRLRLARRGNTIYYLFAEEDSDYFRLFGTETTSGGDIEPNGIRLQVQCSGNGTSSAVWKSVTLRAERMTWHPDAATPSPQILRLMQADGTGLRTLLAPEAAGFTHLGSPEWSADGRKITLDLSTGSTTTSHVFVINADGSELRDLGLGCMPSFSGDGKRLVFSQPGEGVVMMNADGSGRQVLEANAWGTQWSPDGKSIVYVQPGNITLFDVATKRTRSLLAGDAATRYDLIYWNLGWSHDSRSIGFKARRREGKGDELAVVDIAAPQSFQVLMSDAKAVAPDCTWSPDNQSLIVPIQGSSAQGAQLHRVSRKRPGLPELLPAQPGHLKISGCDWSPDGKQIVIASQESPQPREWTGASPHP